MSIKTKLMTACAGVLLVGGIGASVANAKLVIDLRQDGTNAKEVLLSGADLNHPITINIFARVTGVDGNAGKETLKSIGGSVVTTGTTRANIAPGFVYPNPDYDPDDPTMGPPTFGPLVAWHNSKHSFAGTGSLDGLKQDIDGDGDIDLGGKASGGLDWIILRTDYAFLMPDPNPGKVAAYYLPWGPGSGALAQGTKILQESDRLWKGGVEFQVGVITVTPTALGGNTMVNWLTRVDASGKQIKDAGLWTEDTDVANPAPGLRDGGMQGVIMETSGFLMIIPEPASLSMLGLGAAMLLGRRNRK